MGYEIDYLAVGEGERSADAIALRFGNLHGSRAEQTIVTIDGGTLEAGQNLVDHVKKFYQTDRVNFAVLSHPDVDHASGMRAVLEQLKVGQLVMHLPWNHSSTVKELLEDSSVTVSSLKAKAKRNLSAAHEIEQLARSKGIPIVEPFAGVATPDGVFKVLGPTLDYYEDLMCEFRCLDVVEARDAGERLAAGLRALGEAVRAMLPESWFGETLADPAEDATSAENNSSAIFLFELDGHGLLFTGDAGVPALSRAVDYADQNRISLAGVKFFHVPHHGSKRNLGPTILNRIFGAIRSTDSQDWTAYISAAKDGAPKHPNKKVMNALKRRGAGVYVTAGIGLCHRHEVPQRAGWSVAQAHPLYTQVESDD